MQTYVCISDFGKVIFTPLRHSCTVASLLFRSKAGPQVFLQLTVNLNVGKIRNRTMEDGIQVFMVPSTKIPLHPSSSSFGGEKSMEMYFPHFFLQESGLEISSMKTRAACVCYIVWRYHIIHLKKSLSIYICLYAHIFSF